MLYHLSVISVSRNQLYSPNHHYQTVLSYNCVVGPAPIKSDNLYQHANCPGIRVLQGLDEVIVSGRVCVEETGPRNGAVRIWGVWKDDCVQGGPTEGRVIGVTTKSPSRL